MANHREPAGDGDAGRKPRRTSEQEEAESRRYNRFRSHEAPILVPTTAPTGLTGSFPTIPHEYSTWSRLVTTLGVKALCVSPVEDVLFGQHVLQAPGPTDTEMRGARTADPRIIRTPMPPILGPMREEVARYRDAGPRYGGGHVHS